MFRSFATLLVLLTAHFSLLYVCIRGTPTFLPSPMPLLTSSLFSFLFLFLFNTRVFYLNPNQNLFPHSSVNGDEMVGLSIVLEGYNNNNNEDITTITSGSTSSNWQILNKASMFIKPTSPSTIASSPFSQRKTPAPSWFLDSCFLCNQKLLPDKDIYMYKGDWAFCSVECRCKQIFMDEQESIKTRKNMKSQASTSSNNKYCTSSSSPSSSSSSSRSRKTAARNRPNGFAH